MTGEVEHIFHLIVTGTAAIVGFDFPGEVEIPCDVVDAAVVPAPGDGFVAVIINPSLKDFIDGVDCRAVTAVCTAYLIGASYLIAAEEGEDGEESGFILGCDFGGVGEAHGAATFGAVVFIDIKEGLEEGFVPSGGAAAALATHLTWAAAIDCQRLKETGVGISFLTFRDGREL